MLNVTKVWAIFLVMVCGSLSPLANAQQSEEKPAFVKQFETQLVHWYGRGNESPSYKTVEQQLESWGVPGASVAIIQNDQIVWAKGYGTKQAGRNVPVDADTVFSVGSVSKIINAALILKLVAEGTLDLDKDVNTYLKRWKVPVGKYNKTEPVTLRRILAHTAGFSQHGFPDFAPGEAMPTALQTLNGEAPAKHGKVHLMFTPGKHMDYSGGGITVSQLVVEDVTGLDYNAAARKYVFAPLGMARSTFANPLPASHGNIAHAHNEKGKPAAPPRGWEGFAELAASGLWTSANDLAHFVIALNRSVRGTGNYLPKALAQDMMTRVKNSWHGLGPRLNGEAETRVFHHGGANNSYRAWIEGHIASGDGIVVLTNGTSGHFVHKEIRLSAEKALNWPVTAEDGFEEPEF